MELTHSLGCLCATLSCLLIYSHSFTHAHTRTRRCAYVGKEIFSNVVVFNARLCVRVCVLVIMLIKFVVTHTYKRTYQLFNGLLTDISGISDICAGISVCFFQILYIVAAKYVTGLMLLQLVVICMHATTAICIICCATKCTCHTHTGSTCRALVCSFVCGEFNVLQRSSRRTEADLCLPVRVCVCVGKSLRSKVVCVCVCGKRLNFHRRHLHTSISPNKLQTKQSRI